MKKLLCSLVFGVLSASALATDLGDYNYYMPVYNSAGKITPGVLVNTSLDDESGITSVNSVVFPGFLTGTNTPCTIKGTAPVYTKMSDGTVSFSTKVAIINQVTKHVVTYLPFNGFVTYKPGQTTGQGSFSAPLTGSFTDGIDSNGYPAGCQSYPMVANIYRALGMDMNGPYNSADSLDDNN
ncbi:MAG: hypothetical protein RLZZ293_977 [Pseudomonadota bacterium]|jgi:hypothetical protein